MTKEPGPDGERGRVDASADAVGTRPARRVDAPDSVDEASQESFPASDPPVWSSMRAGPPRT